MKKIVFDINAFDDFNKWSKINKKIYDKIVALIKDINRNPFAGTGKPEKLKNELSGYYSRRINDEHRLVYKVEENEIIVISCKYHYEI